MEIRTVSLEEFAEIVGMSVPSVKVRLAKAGDEPRIGKRGKNGVAYEIPVPDALEWWREQLEAESAVEKARRDGIAALQLDFLGTDTAVSAHDVEGLTPGEQAAQLDAELKAIKLGQIKGEYVRADDVERVAGAFMLAVHSKFSSLGDRLRKRADLPADVADALDRLVRRDLEELAQAAENIGVTIAQEAAAANSALPAGG